MLTKLNFYLIFLFLLFWLGKFLLNYFHLMNLLIMFEFMMLANSLILMEMVNNNELLSLVFLIYFVISVMEACVGLSILIFVSRNLGEEFKFLF